MTKRLIIFVLIIVILVAIALWSRAGVTPQSGTISVQGQVVCLPHKNLSGPQTLECAIGLRDGFGNYYGLRNTNPPIHDTNIKIEVAGNLAPETSSNYNIVGTIEVVSWKKL